MSTGRVCVVMAFDTKMFHQAKACLELLRGMKVPGWTVSVVVLDLGLQDEEMHWLSSLGCTIAKNADVIPNFSDAPGYMRAMTCRPYMRDLIPNHDVYMWLDADIRMVSPEALEMYVLNADAQRDSVVLVQEVDPTYGFVRDPKVVRNYHVPKRKRMADVYGDAVAESLDGFLCFNAGIFAMHKDSVIWKSYRQNLELAMKTPFDHMKEQDAMNVAIVQNDLKAVALTAQYNWLCSSSQPIFNKEQNRWVRPLPPHNGVAVLHLAASNTIVEINGKTCALYEYYQLLGMTK